MKRGKDDEKIMEPMFPRLHVNDTEKGGPRGPPRNKMALYEQFSIPSQRSISQGSDHQKSAMFPPLHLNRAVHPAEESCAGYSNYNPPSPKVEQRMKLDEEDFTVPILVQSEIGQDHSKNSSGMNRGKLFSFGPTYSGHSMEVQNSSDREPKRARSQLRNSLFEYDVSNEHARGIGSGLGFRTDYCSEELGSPNSSTSNSVCHEDETCGSLNIGNEDRGDDASEISVVDCIPGLDICPDDVVAVIGQKHFLKARRAIVNQQRMFAVQVFELHKLIKVQKLFAGSPHLLVDDGAYLGKPLKGSSAKKLPLELVVKPYPRDVKHNDDSSKPSHNMECSAENAVGKTSLSSVQNDSNVLNNKPVSTPYISDATTSPWGFHQPPGQQWLIPVVSPSEGLIYKPYNPGHGFMGSLCGGCGVPPGSNPMLANFVNPAYGVASSHHPYQGIGGPPYGMQFVNGAISNIVKPRATKERSELQGISMESSPGKGARGIRGGPTGGGRNALPLLPTSQAVPDVAHQLRDTDRVTRVIKVVPHKAMSATESVARIFQSIQEGRKQ